MGRNLKSLRYFILAVGVISVAVSALISWFYPPAITSQWLVAFATLLALAIVSVLLAIRISDTGASTNASFIPDLAAIILLGPTGAIGLTIVESLMTEFIILRNDRFRAAFNMAQIVLATGVAAIVYTLAGGETTLTQLPLRTSLPPFALAVVAYFLINSVVVSYAVALRDGRTLAEVWQTQAGRIVLFDVAMSSLAFLVAFLYARWGPLALLSAIVPVIGLRYSYGVNLELQDLNRDLLRVLIRTLEARDAYTSGHSLRVSQRSRAIALALGLRGRKLRTVETAALLHDIGKIDLAYGEILRQKGPLSPEQRELIHAHPDKGVAILSAVRSLDPEILRCVRHHHEWFDGSGYPLGLSGEEIPLGARVIMISDSIDAMLTDRPYRKALSPDEVRRELLRNSGSQFDPMVVEAALKARVLDEAADESTQAMPEPALGSITPAAH